MKLDPVWDTGYSQICFVPQLFLTFHFKLLGGLRPRGSQGQLLVASPFLTLRVMRTPQAALTVVCWISGNWTTSFSLCS